jgi:PKD repeat protein/flagellar hook assembly protein FlgD
MLPQADRRTRRWLFTGLAGVFTGVLAAIVSALLGPGAAGAVGTPTVVVYQPASHRYFSPNGDGQDDTLSVYYCLAASANVTITVTDPTGHPVRTVEAGVSHGGGDPCFGWNNWFQWDGKNDTGATVPDAVYTARVHAVDATGQTGDDTVQIGVDTRIPGGLTTPRPGDTLSGTLAWRFAPTPGFTIGTVNVYCTGSWLGAASAPGTDGTFTGSGDTTTCLDGANAISASAYWTDPFGYGQSWTAPAVPVTVDNVPRLAIYQPGSRRSFSPDGDGQDDTTTVYYCLSKGATVTVSVADPGGTVVRTLAPVTVTGNASYCAGWNNWFEWDGKDDAGRVVPDREYTVRVHAADPSGHTADDTVQVAVDTRVPGRLTAPVAGATVAGTVDWTFAPGAGFTFSQVNVYCNGSSLGTVTAPNPTGAYTGSGDTATCVDGANTIAATVYWTDSLGASRSWTAPPVPVTVANAPRLAIFQSASHRYFSPNGDGQDDSTTVLYCLSKTATESATIVDAQGSTVRTYAPVTVGGFPSGCNGWNNYFEWDGRNDAGTIVPDGVYTVRVHVVDGAGQAADDSVQVGVDTRVPGSLTSPHAGDSVSGTVNWRFAPTAGFTVGQVYVYCSGSSLGYATAPGADGSFTGSGDSTACTDGPNTLYTGVYWTDPFGYSQAYTTSIPVSVDNAVRVSVYQPWSHRYFSPNGDGQEDTSAVYYCLSRSATVTITVTGPDGTTVRTVAPSTRDGVANCFIWSASFDWDGRDDAGTVVPEGVYTVRVHAVDDAGRTGEDTVQVGVDKRTPGVLTTPAPGDTLAGLATFAFQPTSGYPVSTVTITVDTGGGATIFNPSPDGTWRTSLYSGTLHNGPAVLSTTVTSTDPFGAVHNWQAPSTPVVIDATSLPLTVTATPASGAAPLATTLHIGTSDPHAGTVHYSVDYGDGSPGDAGDVAPPYATVDLPHTYVNPGAYRAVVTVTNGTGAASTRAVDVTATGAPNTPPTATLALDHTTGVTPLPVQATIGGTDAEHDPLTYGLDFGDGSGVSSGTLPRDAVAHTYPKAGTYLVRLTVSDGRLSTVQTATVVVGLPEPLAANAGDDQAATVNSTVHFDGSGSRPGIGIESYHWSFGDGGSADGAVVDHAYTTPGTYTATLTVTAGGQTRTDDAVVTVTPVPQESGLVVTVKEGAAPVSGASLVVIDAGGQRFTAQTDAAGTGHLAGLPDGGYAVYAWKSGYQPATATGTVTGGSGTASVDLKPGQVAEASLTSAPLTRDEVVAAGINPDDPANQNVYQFTVNLSVNSSPVTFTGYTGSGGFPLCPTVNGAATSCGGGSSTFTTGGYTVSVSVSYVHNAPELVWLVIPVKASWLKEFFSVQMVVTNLADPAFTLDHGTATLALPAGLSLAPTATPQARSVPVDDVAGGHSGTATWLVRGDTEGFYDLTADYAGSLEPFGDTVTVQAKTAKPLHVWGGSAVQITIDAEKDIYNRYPYRVRVGLKNVADVPVYNAAVELLSQGRQHYLYQPKEALRQGTAQIDPGATFWTDDYILAPDITGTIDLNSSFVGMASGTGGPTATVVTHPALQTPDTAPALTAAGLQSRIGLQWTGIPGATGYEIYQTPDRSTDFPATPVLTVPAGTTNATVPVAPGSTGWFAVSSIVNGRHTLLHPIVEGAPSTRVTIPVSQAKLSSTASCGADVGVTAQFSDPFFDLTGWSAALDGVPYGTANGTLSGRQAAKTFTVKAADIKPGGSRLTITATDSSGATGPAWTTRISKDCNGIRMLVLGDSIAWGQGLQDNDKYPSLVAEYLRTVTHRAVDYDTLDRSLAHSGAVVDPTRGCSPDYLSTVYTGGEVPTGSPDIGNCQVNAAKNMSADLILVDGCINDINALNVVLNPTVDLHDAVQSKCGAPVKAMLSRLHQDHPTAQIVYTGYYPIVDGSLSLLDLAILADRGNLSQAALIGLDALAQSRSATFDSEFRTQATNNVNELDPAGNWLHFADPGYQAGDGVLDIPNSKLFIGTDDPMFGARALACNDVGKLVNTCTVASFGHPNEAGAQKYAAAIENAIATWVRGQTTVPTVKSLAITPSSITLAKGDSQKLTITATFTDGTTGDATALVTLSSDKPAVATVDTPTATVQAVDVGKNAHITAVLTTNTTIKATATVTVTAAVPRSIAIGPPNPLVVAGKTVTLTATVTMSDGTTKTPLARNLTWTAGNPMIATVSDKGVVQGVSVGTASVKVSYTDPTVAVTLTASTIVTVVDGPPKITGFTPASGPVGTRVEIQGFGFLGVTSVTINGVQAQFTVNSSTSITVVVPPGARTGPIVVTSPLGSDRSKTRFTVT